MSLTLEFRHPFHKIELFAFPEKTIVIVAVVTFSRISEVLQLLGLVLSVFCRETVALCGTILSMILNSSLAVK